MVISPQDAVNDGVAPMEGLFLSARFVLGDGFAPWRGFCACLWSRERDCCEV